MDRPADSLPDDIDALRALVATAIAERDAAIAERDRLIELNDRLRRRLPAKGRRWGAAVVQTSPGVGGLAWPIRGGGMERKASVLAAS